MDHAEGENGAFVPVMFISSGVTSIIGLFSLPCDYRIQV